MPHRTWDLPRPGVDQTGVPCIARWILHHRRNPFKEFHLFIYLFLAVLGLPCYEGFFLAAESWSYSPVAVHRLLIMVASLVSEHGLQGRQASVGTQA